MLRKPEKSEIQKFIETKSQINLKTRVHFCIMYQTSAYCIKPPKKTINHGFTFAKSLTAALTDIYWVTPEEGQKTRLSESTCEYRIYFVRIYFKM